MGSYLGAFNESNQTSIALSATFPLRSDYKIKSTNPFSSARKFSAVSFNEIGTFLLGAPEYIYKGKDKAILKYISDKESLGFRVVILCHVDGEIKNDEIPSKAEPVAIFTLEDHVRKEAPNTIKWFVENGVAIKIISGDNPITVSNIAKKCGVPDADKCISLEGLSPSEVAELVDQYTVFGRVSPEQKAAIVKELKRRKMTVGMTGDGVNDILAMKQADCSIAMANGSSAARNVAHLVLLDSNFASMPSVVREGRRVVNNIQRSSSLFLMKTIFTIVFTFIVLMTSAVTGGKGGWIYPFSANNILIMELFCIGLPSFFLALQPNANLIKGHFIKNTFSRAIPAAICLIVAVFINCILFYDTPDFLDTYIYELPNTTVAFTTFCSLTMVVISFGMVYNCCMPFNRYRLILFVSLFAVLLVAIFALPYISALNSNDKYLYWNLSMQFTGTDFRYLTKTMWLVLGIYIALVPSCLNALVDLFANMRGEKPTGLIVNLVSTLKGKNENKNY
jgi:cation-transporting ATPase E